MTKIATLRQCAVCERTLLLGERSVRFAPEEGAELVHVCPLCQETATEHGWIKEGTPTQPTVAGYRRRRRRGLGELLGLSRSNGETIAPPEPILRRLSNDEIAVLDGDLLAERAHVDELRAFLGRVAKCPFAQQQCSLADRADARHADLGHAHCFDYSPLAEGD